MSQKWTCLYCTFENWPNSKKCTVCCNLRFDIESVENNVHACSVTSLENNDGFIDTSARIQSYMQCTTSKVNKCCDAFNEDSDLILTDAFKNKLNVDKNVNLNENSLSCDSIKFKQFLSKWVCNVCTYENWPKSRKCIMCLHPRDSSIRTGCLNENINYTKVDMHNPQSLSIQSHEANLLAEDSSKIMQNETTNNFEDDIRWLNSCLGVVFNDIDMFKNYLMVGGSHSRKLTLNETKILSSIVALDAGDTLVHLSLKYNRNQMLALLLGNVNNYHSRKKCIPPLIAEELARNISCHIHNNIRFHNTKFPMHYVVEFATFTLPAEISDLHPYIQEQLWDELLAHNVQKELETDHIINWSEELCSHSTSRLYALWNRTAGDCLLDSALQATWGILDKNNVLRNALANSFNKAGHCFYPRWRAYELTQAQQLPYQLDENQLIDDWQTLLNLTAQPGEALDQIHVLVLAHVLRRPIIVYGVKYVKSFYGETLGFGRFEGIYLPLLLEPSLCCKCPISLGYTRGHFSALVPMEPDTLCSQAGSILHEPDEIQVVFLPLTTKDGKLMPIHFLTADEIGSEERIMRLWLEVTCTESGILVAEQHIQKPPLLVAQMLEEWLNHYRRLDHM